MQGLPWRCLHGIDAPPSICSILPCFCTVLCVAKTVMGGLLAWQAAVSREELGGAWQLDGPCICFGPHEHGPQPSTPSWWVPCGDAVSELRVKRFVC